MYPLPGNERLVYHQLLHSSDKLLIGSSSHCLLFRVVRSKQPNSPSSFRGVLRIAVYFFLRCDLRSTATSAPFLKSAHPDRLPDKVLSVPIVDFLGRCVSHSLALSHSRFTQIGELTLSVSGAPHTRLFLHHCFLRFGVGRPLHNVQHLIFHDAT
jgi:hypothetical protein